MFLGNKEAKARERKKNILFNFNFQPFYYFFIKTGNPLGVYYFKESLKQISKRIGDILVS